jgi:hypothetical protein
VPQGIGVIDPEFAHSGEMRAHRYLKDGCAVRSDGRPPLLPAMLPES